MALVAGLAVPVSGQVARGRSTTVEMARPHAARLPYTAEYKITREKTLADGSTITRESTEIVVLDSQGRRMTATTTIPLSGDQAPATHVSVFDPVARTNSNWSVPGQKATVMQMPVPVIEHTSGASYGTSAALPSCLETATSSTLVSSTYASGVPREKPTVEDLGTDTFYGVEAHGRRTTRTIPAGAIGNNEPLQRVDERWTACGFRDLLVRVVSDDPQTGKMTKELSGFNQSDPDIGVFQPPAGYEIVTKNAPASVCPTAQSDEPPPPPAE
jgi:hypothetical protein